MDAEVRDAVREAAEKHALYNALDHGGEAQVGAIMGPLMGENPDFREYADEIPEVITPVIEAVNDQSPDEQRERLADLDESLFEELTKEAEETHPLPDLPNVEEYDTVRMRLAPNPNGPWHIGHARMPAVIGTYKDRYDGWFACRFDDTDPATKRPMPEAYDWILADIEYLGFEPDIVIRASDRLETYYTHARRLIELDGAYTCSCDQADFSELKNAGEACPHRDKAVETSLDEFEGMVAGEYNEGEMVLRVRTQIKHPNPALRDWVAFRLIETQHPRPEAAEYRCWPLLDFQSGIDDHLTEVTHIIRGIDLQDSAKRQEFMYDYFGWEYPEVMHWGKVQIDAYDVALSTSTIAELIDQGELDGWDDPRAPTLRSLRRRGIRGEAIVESMVGLGTSTSNVDLAMSSIYANNRELIDDKAPRRFFVRESGHSGAVDESSTARSVVKSIIGGPTTGDPPIHPDHEDRGRREIPVSGGVRVEADDVPPNGQRVWLKGYGCVRHTRDAFEYVGADISVVRDEDVPVIHWVPTDAAQPLRLRTVDGDIRGFAEPSVLRDQPDTVVQFERVGFARIDAQEDETIAYYSHP